MIRVFYDVLQRGYHFVRGDENFIVPDGAVSELGSLLDRFFAYSDKIQPPLGELFRSDEIEPDLPEGERATMSDIPWEWKGTVPRTPKIMTW